MIFFANEYQKEKLSKTLLTEQVYLSSLKYIYTTATSYECSYLVVLINHLGIISKFRS